MSKMSMDLNSAEEMIVTVNRQHLKLTHLHKVLWPELGYTKGDLVAYYHRIAKFILPYLKNRPQVLHRFPNGVTAEGFYQKNMAYAPDWLTMQPIRSDTEKRLVNYLICKNEASLLYMANAGCIDMNPWLARYNSLNKPDFCVLDLDPHEIDFEAVIEIALLIHQLLQSLHVPHYCKTSGASGLHIFIPLKGNHTFEQSRQFAEWLFTVIHQQSPNITSLERLPKQRKGKIYLDYLQNRIGQTMAAPYSIRPQAQATISTPLHWHEVKSGLTPLDFTLKNIDKRLAKEGDIWQPLLKGGISIGKVLKGI